MKKEDLTRGLSIAMAERAAKIAQELLEEGYEQAFLTTMAILGNVLSVGPNPHGIIDDVVAKYLHIHPAILERDKDDSTRPRNS